MDFRYFFSLFLRRLPWFLVIVILCSAVGITLARILPTVYVAQARLVVESEQIPGNLAASTVEMQAIEQLQIIQQRILTRDTLIEMANRLRIYSTDDPSAPQTRNADEIVADLRERVRIVTTGGEVRRGAVQATFVSVSFEAPSPTLAAAVANEVVTLILREDVQMRTGVARQTLEFFDQEATRLESELAQRSAAILEFKQANQDALPDSLDFRRAQQAAGQERLLQFDRAIAEITDRRARLVTLHDATGDVDATLNPRQLTPEQQRLRNLKDELAASLSILSPENPKVKLLQAQIDGLERIVAGQSAAGRLGPEGQALTPFEIQLADMDGQIKFLQDQQELVRKEMAELKESIEATPGNAIALQTLERDYENTRQQYDRAVANKARAETGDMIEALSKGRKISVIEQAVAPREPDRPNRPAIAAAGVGGGVALGFGMIVLLELLRSGIQRPVDLTSKLGITPFATLPYIQTRQEVRMRRYRLAGTFAVILAILGIGLWALTIYMPLDQLILTIQTRLGLDLPALKTVV